MKRIFCTTIFVIMALMLGACSLRQRSNDTLITAFPKDNAPSQVVKTENYWVYLMSIYSGSDYGISVSTKPEEVNTIYTVEDVSIWYIEANDNCVVWSEKSNDSYEYKIYSMESETVETIMTVDAELGFQPRNVGIYEDKIYFPHIDYTNQKADILCYDVSTKKVTSVYNLPFNDDLSVMSLLVEKNYMSVASADGLAVIDLDSNEVVRNNPLPQDVEYVYAFSYDYINDTCAIYYADSDSEDIGVVNEDDLTVTSILTFNENHYAFQDKIKCVDGHIYWISQANVSGNVSDHYRYVDYDYIIHKPIETKRAFNVYVNESNEYYLKYDRDGDYQKIELYER